MKLLLTVIAVMGFCTVANAQQQWTQFRGPGGTGSAKNAVVPIKVGEKKNIKWSAELPGRGPSSPIVVGDKVFVTASHGDKQNLLVVFCFDAKSGKQIWKRNYWATGRTVCHPLSANAAPTPVSDGKNIYAFFSSNDLVCLDLDGNLKWFRGLAFDYPKAANDTGMSSSPVIVDGIVVVQIENQAESFAAGIDAKTGKTVWRIEREPKAAWSSPIIIPATSMRPNLVVLQSQSKATVHHAKTGKQIWEYKGRGGAIPSPVFVNDTLYLAFDGTTAFKVSDTGQFEKLWNSRRMAPSSSSIVVDKDKIYSLNRGGIANCFNAKTGERMWQVRLGGQYWSTPVLVAGHLYFFTQKGKAKVVEVSNDAGRIAYEHDFKETFLGTPAVSKNAMYIRSDNHIWKIAGDE